MTVAVLGVTGTSALGMGVLGAGASIYGASQQPEGISPGQMPSTGYNPYADPMLSALSLNAGAGIGQFDPNTYMQASPLQQLLASASASGTLTVNEMKHLQGALNYDPEVMQQGIELWKAVKPQGGGFFKSGIGSLDYRSLATGGIYGLASDKSGESSGGHNANAAWKKFLADNGMTEKSFIQAKKGMVTADRLARNAGYENMGALHTANKEYLGKLPEIQAQYQPVADSLRKGLLSSQGRIGQYLQDLPNLLTGDANPFIDQLRNEALTSSQKYGYNPYQGLEQARSQALQRALQLIQGEQVVQGGQQQAALPVAQLRQQGGANAASLGAGQAAMLAGALNSQQSAQSAQAQSWGNIGGNLLGMSAGAFGSLSGPATGMRPSNGIAPGATDYGDYFNNVGSGLR